MSTMPAHDRCPLTVMVKRGEPPIRCRRRIWAADIVTGVCYACHPSGRELFVEAIVRRVLAFRDGGYYGKDRRNQRDG